MTDPAGGSDLDAAAAAYAGAVRTLLQPAAGAAADRERGVGAPSGRDAEQLADELEALLPLSDAVTAAAATDLADASPDVRDRSAERLLAKATTDLDIAARALEASIDEEEGGPARPRGADRAVVADTTETERLLEVLLGEARAGPGPAERGGAPPRSAEEARATLATEVEDSLALISRRAASAGTKAVEGIAAVGVEQLGHVLGMVGSNLADALGIGEHIGRLVRAARALIAKAHDAVVKLLGLGTAQAAGKQIVDWVRDHLTLERALVPLYATDATGTELRGLISASDAPIDRYVDTTDAVRDLDGRYGDHIQLAERFVKLLNRVAGLVARVLPHGTLAIAATDVAIASYIVVVGADYVDSPHFRILDRVPGVRAVVEQALVPPPGR